ncbi:uncharacterized protein LOC121374738 [Gigantopelta aegis]|uniref:uncharacterized protein LOC121374738 n=1 Tax=Gigantopelta aegis TaxID=1735272 RepID=UPI001B88AB44|nr:uncharacterized protein LOC121374738 [Gigantopelta aegis]
MSEQLDSFVEQMLIPVFGIDTELMWNQFFENDVVLSQQQLNSAKALYKELKEKVLNGLNSDRCGKWDSINAGSIFDQTKVDEPDEFDCLLVPRIPSGYIKAEYESAPPGFCYIRVLEENCFTEFCERGYLSSKKWRDHFTSRLKEIVTGINNWECLPSYDGSAAVPVSCRTRSTNDIDVDLVPALHVLSWPSRARSRDEIDKIIPSDGLQGHHVVAKAYKENGIITL